MKLIKTGTFLIFIFASCFIQGVYAASGLKEVKDNASNYYAQGKYEDAIALWNGLVTSGNSDPNLFYNIGNAQSMQGNTPEAILAYEKALRYKPADGKIREAIRKERNKIENAVIPVNAFFIVEWSRIGLALLRPGYWALLGLFVLLGALMQWLASIHIINRFGIIHGKRIWIILAVGTLILLISVLSYHQVHRKDEAIVMTTCEFHQAPSIESPLIRSLAAGEKVNILDNLADWYKVSLLNLDQGWMKKDCLNLIQVGK